MKRMHTLFESLFLSRRKRRVISIAMLLLLGGMVFFIPKIKYRSEITDFFPSGNEKVAQFKALEKAFGNQDALIVLLDFGAIALNSKPALEALNNAVNDVEAVQGVQSVRSFLDFPISIPTGDEWQTSTLRTLLKQDSPQLEYAQSQLADALSAPSVWASHNGKIASLQILFYTGDTRDSAYQQVIAKLDAHAEFKATRFGPLEIQKELQRSLIHDGLYLMPVVILVGVALMWIFLRSVWLIAAGTLAIVSALLLTAGLVGYLDISVNQTSVLAFGIVFIVTLAEVIHILVGYLYACQTLSKNDAMQSTLEHNLGSLFLTSFTTFLGFISLNISNSPAFAMFGNIAAVGASFALLSTVTLLPTLCEWGPRPQLHRIADKIQTSMGQITALALQYPKTSLAIVTLITLFALPGLPFNHFQNDPLDYFSETTNIHQSTKVFEQQFSVKHHITVHIGGKKTDAMIQPSTLATLSRFRRWAESQPDISYIIGFDTTLAHIQSNLHENDPRWAEAPLHYESLAELLNVFQMSSPHNTLRSLGLNTNLSSAVVSVGIPPLSSDQIAEISRSMQVWFNHEAPQLAVSITGHAPLFAEIGQTMTRNMVFGDLATVAVITLVLAGGLRSMRMGLISLIPNIIPPAVIYGFWGYLSGKIDIAAAGAFSMGMGIIVDDTVHIMRNYLLFRRAGHDNDESLRLTFEHAGPALVLNTFVLSGGLSVFCLATFGPNKVTAQLMSSTIALALAYDFCMLPLVLRWADKTATKPQSITRAQATSEKTETTATTTNVMEETGNVYL